MLRNGRKAYQRVLFEKSSILDYLKQTSSSSSSSYSCSSILVKQQQQQQSRNYYSRFPLLFRKLKDFTFSPPSLYSPSSSSCSSSSSTFIGNGFVNWYLRMIKTHPIATKSITSAAIYTAADVSSQMLTDTLSESYDFLRTLRMAGYGMLLAGPSMHFWFNSISKVLPQRDIITTLKKIFVGQIVYGPIMTAVFFSLNAGLQGENGAEIVARLKRDLLPTLTNGLLYWPMCDFVTFKFIPVHLQPLMTNSFAYLWTIYITYMASLNKVSPAIAEAELD